MTTVPPPAVRRPIATLLAGLAVTALSIGPVALAPAARAATPADDVRAHVILDYDFTGATSVGATVADSSGKGHDGVLTNSGSAQLVDGPAGGKALHLAGGAARSTTAPFITVPPGVFQGLQATTVSSWVKWDGGDAFQWLYTLGKDKDSATFYTPRFQGDDKARSSVKPTSQGEVGASGSTALPANEWHLVTTTLDANALVYYLDGFEVSRTSVGADVADALYAASSPNSGFIGQPFWTGVHPFFAGAIDDFQVYDTALTAAQVRALAGDSAPTVTTVTQTAVEVQTDVGSAPQLPSGVTADYSDGQQRLAPVTWADVPSSAYAQRGVFTVAGTVDGTATAVTATVRVTTPNELSIDVGDRTGAFMGGASGTLYGLYGPGLPSNNLIDGIQLRTVSTKAQDGPQHPGADALEVVKPLADSSNGDVYIYMTDINRGFPYEVPGDNGTEKEAWYFDAMAKQVDQVLQLPAEYQKRIVFVPFNEPEGNMYGNGGQSFWGQSWLDNPDRFFSAWDRAYRMIMQKMPDARIGGPNTSILFDQDHAFLQHAIANDTVPQVFTWHELSNPATIRDSVAKYRGWEDELFAGTKWDGQHLPINVNEYAFNYHTSVPAQMIQWISAIEDSKIDADIAYWNIDGNLSDSAVQSNRGNGQWWLLNAYGNMTGDTVRVHPPKPGESYTLQGVATVDDANKKVHALLGGSSGDQAVYVDRLPDYLSGSVHVQVRDIRWTGQIGDSGEPQTVAEFDAPVSNGSLALRFGQGDLPPLGTDSAYEIIVTPGQNASSPAQSPVAWRGVYEAEDARFTGATPEINGPEGTPSNVGGFYTSGTKDVGGIRAGSNLQIHFDVDVPTAGAYDLSVLASAYNKDAMNEAQGPVNMFVTVNGGAEQEISAELGYKWVVWNHTDTKVDLQAGKNTITIAAKSLDGSKQTVGTAIIDKIDLTQPNPGYTPIYEAENAVLHGTASAYDRAGVSGSGYVPVSSGQSVTFWVYNKDDSEKALQVATLGGGSATLRVNGVDLGQVSDTTTIPAFLVGGINKVEVVGRSGTVGVDRIAVEASENVLASQTIEAESGTIAGTAKTEDLSLASGGKAVVGIGGAPGNGNTLTNTVTVAEAGTYAMTLRYSNEEQSPASHYNPDPVARRADISVNGGPVQKVLFPQSYNANQFWDLTVEVQLNAGENTVRFSSEEQPDFNGVTYISQRYPALGLRSQWAPNLDRLTFTALKPATAAVEASIAASSGSAVQGGTVTVTGSGFAPGETVALELHSDVVALGETTADATGAVSAVVTVPASAPVGAHHIVAIGRTSQRTASTALAVTAAEASGGGAGDGATGGSPAGGAAAPVGSSGAAPSELAATGGAFAGGGVLLAAAGAIAAGAALIARRRSRSVA